MTNTWYDRSFFWSRLIIVSSVDDQEAYQSMRIRMKRKALGLCVANLAWEGYTTAEKHEFNRVRRIRA